MQMQKQMNKVHQSHLRSSYLRQVRYDATTDDDGQPNCLLHYTPVQKLTPIHRLHASAGGRGGSGGASSDRDCSGGAGGDGPRKLSPPHPQQHPEETALHVDPLLEQAHALVTAFYQRFHGVTAGSPQPKELEHAAQLLAQHGAATAHFLVDFSYQAAHETAYQPRP